ncbi:copper amine oxidase [Aspergillus pseudotamarii]|uniref:Amine oxidase n=1 Tax=Aspergillus pseudotamarii TaxID=132259 RepID=A0A5N6SXQ0_ASPPS|nr:copper amine oxidase [Aspergillus pseudotamarii]KAE8139456.1 copper amine oxidase [Aspergillus pseudotamarii]
MSLHPLDPATPWEIQRATNLVKKAYEGTELHFKAAGLEEPPKRGLVPFLDTERNNHPLPLISRYISLWYIKRTPRLFEVIVDVTDIQFIHHAELPRDFHGPVNSLEMNEAVQVVMADPRVKEEIKRLKIGDTTVVLGPWDYGVDGEETQRRRTQIEQHLVFMYMRNPKNNDPDSNHYGFLLDFMVTVDLSEMKVEKITRLPLGSDQTATPIGSPPEGASFAVKGRLIQWGKWRFRVGFDWREGMTLHDVSFDGKNTFYRLCLSQMFVTYGDPRNPIYRKGAFDLGNVGAGVTANNLMSMAVSLRKDAGPAPRPNVICIHEIDNGIQRKHTNHRTGKAALTFETRATGILSTQLINKDAKVPWGTPVADGVMAPYHQHLFNLRIDPADAYINPLGTGYITEQTILNRAGPVGDDISKGRVFTILNENVENPVSLTPIGYKLVSHRPQMLLVQPASWHWRRSESCETPIWVTKYNDRQLFPAGNYTNQSLGGTGIKSWIEKSRDVVRNEDIVVWHTFGFTHNPCVEDFPIMLAEIAQVRLVPYNFCLYNPAIDVPPSNQDSNQSTEYKAPEGSQSSTPSDCFGNCRSY